MSSLQRLQRFYESKDLNDLQSSITKLTSAVDMPRIHPSRYVARRRMVVRAWAQILRAIETSYDPTFDQTHSDDLPQTCVLPPREAEGTQLPPCVDPSDLTDANARLIYVAAIARNEAKAKRANFQSRLRYLDGFAMLSLRMNLDLFRKVTRSDSVHLDAILRQAGLGDSRRSKIDAEL